MTSKFYSLRAPAVKLLATSAVQHTATASVHGTSPGAHQTDGTGQPPVLDNRLHIIMLMKHVHRILALSVSRFVYLVGSMW
jgi:hypothetical protein